MEPILDPEHEDLERSLLNAGRRVGMSPSLEKKTLAALGIGVIGVATASTAKAAWLSGKGWLVALGVSGSLGALGVVAYQISAPHSSPPVREVTPPPAQTVAPRQSATDADLPPQKDEGPAASDEASGSDPQEDSRATHAPAPVSPKVASPKDNSPSTLGAELEHIARAETALKKGQANEALRLLSDYRAQFSHPKLGLEAEVLTIQALAESGAAESAAARAQAFLNRYPKSPLRARVKRYIK